jgi:hypothetical protein
MSLETMKWVSVDYRLVLGKQQDRGEVRYLVGVVIGAGSR